MNPIWILVCNQKTLVSEENTGADGNLRRLRSTILRTREQTSWRAAFSRLHKLTKMDYSYSDYSSIETFDQTGAVNYTDLLNTYNDAYSTLEQDAGYILSENLQDRSFRSGLSLSGWKPGKNMQAQATEWWQFDWEYGQSPVGRRPPVMRIITELSKYRKRVPRSLLLSIMCVSERLLTRIFQADTLANLGLRTQLSINIRMRTTMYSIKGVSIRSSRVKRRRF